VQQTSFSEARAELAELFDRALQHNPTKIDRRRADPAVLVSLADFKDLLRRYEFAPEVLFEADSVAIWLPELAIWGRGHTFDDAREDLLDEVDELLAQLEADSRLRSAPNTVDRLPWIFRLTAAEGDDERLALLFAAPAGNSAVPMR
jgi:cytochrome c556